MFSQRSMGVTSEAKTILKTLISLFRCVWLGLELNSVGQRLSRTKLAFPCPRSALGSLPSWRGPAHMMSGRHPDQMHEPPQLAYFNAEAQRLCSKSLLDVRASHLVYQGQPRHPVEKIVRFYLESRSFGHYPELMTIGEVWNIDWLVYLELRLQA